MQAALLGAGIDGEIIIIDDGSTDDTAAVARISGPRVRVITFPVNRGRAHAIAEGFAQAAGWAVAVMDSDGQYDPRRPRDSPRRPGRGGRRGQRPPVRPRRLGVRRLVSGVYNTVLMRGVLGVRSRDANSGLKLFRPPPSGARVRPDGIPPRPPLPGRMGGGPRPEGRRVPIRHRPRAAGSSYIRPAREARNTVLDLIAFRRAVRRVPVPEAVPLEG